MNQLYEFKWTKTAINISRQIFRSSKHSTKRTDTQLYIQVKINQNRTPTTDYSVAQTGWQD